MEMECVEKCDKIEQKIGVKSNYKEKIKRKMPKNAILQLGNSTFQTE